MQSLKWTSYPDVQDWTSRSQSFSEIAAMLRVDAADLTGTASVEHIKVGRVSEKFFSVLGLTPGTRCSGLPPALGGSWTQAEEDHRAPVAVISHAFWHTHFAGGQDAVGASVEIDHIILLQAEQEMNSISNHLEREYPLFEAVKSTDVVPLPDELLGAGTRTGLWTLSAAVFFLLLIGCANQSSPYRPTDENRPCCRNFAIV